MYENVMLRSTNQSVSVAIINLVLMWHPCLSYVVESAHPASIRRWESLGVGSFDSPMFPQNDCEQRKCVLSSNGARIIVPDFDVMFSRVAEVSPLARQVLESSPTQGFDEIEEGACFSFDSIRQMPFSVRNPRDGDFRPATVTSIFHIYALFRKTIRK